MELKQAQSIAQEAIAYLSPSCMRIEVVGSIRRKRAFPNDVDLLLIPGNQGQTAVALHTLGTPLKMGAKVVQRRFMGAQVDIYIATPDTWHTLLLIRTGSKEHNVRLTTLAKRKGWHLYADGRGLYGSLRGEKARMGNRIAGDSEESIFKALGIPYLAPERREVGPARQRSEDAKGAGAEIESEGDDMTRQYEILFTGEELDALASAAEEMVEEVSRGRRWQNEPPTTPAALKRAGARIRALCETRWREGRTP